MNLAEYKIGGLACCFNQRPRIVTWALAGIYIGDCINAFSVNDCISSCMCCKMLCVGHCVHLSANGAMQYVVGVGPVGPLFLTRLIFHASNLREYYIIRQTGTTSFTHGLCVACVLTVCRGSWDTAELQRGCKAFPDSSPVQ